MIFVSYWFVAFALIFFPVYWALHRTRLRLPVLIAGSVLFHGHFAGPAGVLPIVVLAVVTYVVGISRRRLLCVLGMALCAAALVFYKYTQFLSLQVLGYVSPSLGEGVLQSVRPIMPDAPPLAISFFVFEFIHYLFDVRRGEPPIKNPLHFTLFAIFWPSIVAGPIKRFEQFIPALLRGGASASKLDAAHGLLRVSSGLLKKGLADNLTIWIDYYAPQFETLDPGWRWVFFVVLALRIYWDFSGYSDMAIGYAQMLGIRLPENFNWPYVAGNIGDFWRRWHISLSSWIRDYIYIPIGGSRHGVPRKVFNSLVAFAFTGLWHGADWNFVAWGLYHGLGLVISGNYATALGRPGLLIADVFQRVPPLGVAITFLFVGFGWFLFFYPLPVAVRMMQLLATGF